MYKVRNSCPNSCHCHCPTCLTNGRYYDKWAPWGDKQVKTQYGLSPILTKKFT